MSFVRFRTIALWLGVCAALILAAPEIATANSTTPPPASPAPMQELTWKGTAGDGRWSNPANWAQGRVPGASDIAYFGMGALDAHVDAAFDGVVGGIVLASDFTGRVRLEHDLTIRGDLTIEGGTFDGGASRFWIAGHARVSRGTLTTPSALMRVTTLDIAAEAIVRLGSEGKLELAGNGTPLTGAGKLDTTTNRPNSIEYTGNSTTDLVQARPLNGLDVGVLPPLNRPNNAAPDSFFVSGIVPMSYQETLVTSAVIDPDGGYAYFGTNTDPGIVVKVRLSDFTRVGALVLNNGESSLLTAVIDTKLGYAYWGSAGKVISIRLSDFTRQGALELADPSIAIGSSVIDDINGFAYFGTMDQPGTVFKVQLSNFTLAGALTLNAGEDNLTSAAIETLLQTAYFGTSTEPGIVVKINLTDMTRVDAITLNSGENDLRAAVSDQLRGYVYFGTYTQPGIVVKINSLTFSREDALTLDAGQDYLVSAVIHPIPQSDPTENHIYFGTDSSPGTVVQVKGIALERVDAVTLNTGEDQLEAAVIDVEAGYLYFGTNTIQANVVKVSLEPARVGALLLEYVSDGGSANAMAVDTNNQYLYVGAYTEATPGIVFKMRLSDFATVGVVTLNAGENRLASAVIQDNKLYLGTFTAPGIVIRIPLSTFMRDSAATLSPGQNYLRTALSLPIRDNNVFFGTYTAPGMIIRSVGAGVSPPPIVLAPGENYLSSVTVFDELGMAYFGTDTAPGRVIKVDLGHFYRVGALVLRDADAYLTSAAFDLPTATAYFGTNTEPGRVIQVNVDNMTITGEMPLNPGEDNLTTAAIDSPGGFVYFGTDTSPGIVVKIDLTNFTRVDAIMLAADEISLRSSAVDTVGRNLYMGTFVFPSQIVQIDISETLNSCGVDKPDAVKLLSPPGKESLKKKRVNLVWTPSRCAETTYRVIVRENTKKGERIVKVETPENQFKTIRLERGKRYLWRIKACNEKGCTPTPWRRFYISP